MCGIFVSYGKISERDLKFYLKKITLRGKVLPVGGIKEKILAAKRARIKEIILSIENKKNILDIDKSYLKGLKFHYVSNMKEVIDLAITKQKVKNHKIL